MWKRTVFFDGDSFEEEEMDYISFVHISVSTWFVHEPPAWVPESIKGLTANIVRHVSASKLKIYF